jgi:hypothetical protein
MLFYQPNARMDDTGLAVIVRHYIGLPTQKAQRQARRLKRRSAFAFIEGLLQFYIVIFNDFAPKRSLVAHPLLHVFGR